MADPNVTQQTDAVEYGEQGAVDAQAASMPAAVPPVDPKAIADAAVTPQALVAQEAQQPPQQGYTIRNPYMLLPAKMNFGQFQEQKTQVEQKYDAGLLFEVLGKDNPAMQSVADELLGR